MGIKALTLNTIYQNWSKIPEAIKYVPAEYLTESPDKEKTGPSTIIAYHPFRSQLTCPEITDEIAAMFSDQDVVLIATMSQLRKIKHFGIFLRKNGRECGSIQVSLKLEQKQKLWNL